MAYKECFWMACDSTEQLRAEYGPFHTRAEAESEARKLGFGYLLRYEHVIGQNDEIQEVRCIDSDTSPRARTAPRRRPEGNWRLARHLRLNPGQNPSQVNSAPHFC